MTDQSIDISVVIAAYNEDAVIGENLKRVVEALTERPGVRWEVICVNDGSSDKTGAIIEEFAVSDVRFRIIHHRRNFGQGRALRTAFDVCRGETIVTLDADLSYGPEYVYLLVDALDKENADIALASAYMKGGLVRNVSFYRHLLSRIGNFYLARMSHYPVSTSTCVVRAYRREVLNAIPLTSDGMELQLEALMKSSMFGFRVCEIPAKLEWVPDKAADTDITRVSKMRILRTIRLYLLMGWLFRPAIFFIGLAGLLLLPGCYMAVILIRKIILSVAAHMDEGILLAISSGFQDVFMRFTYSFAICGGLLLIGLQILAFALLLLQNKFYFDELYKLTALRERDDYSGR